MGRGEGPPGGWVGAGGGGERRGPLGGGDLGERGEGEGIELFRSPMPIANGHIHGYTIGERVGGVGERGKVGRMVGWMGKG